MKKIALVSVLFVMLFAAGTAIAGDRVYLSAGLAYLHPADSGYRDVYGSQVFCPEFQAGVRLFRGLHLMGGIGTFSKNGTTPELELPAKSTQTFFTVGLAYIAPVSKAFGVKLEAGAAQFSYKEEAMETSVSGSKLGFEAGMGLLWLGKALLAGVNLSYISASDTVEDVAIKLGGAKGSVFIGVRF
jgi:hypothetical protein